MNVAASYTLFDTAIGRCAIAWRGGLVISTALPGADDEATLRHLLRRAPRADEAAADGVAADAIGLVRRLLGGEAVDLSVIPVDLAACPDFERRIYERLREVPTGATVTYGELARRAGAPGAARAVGMAMGRNPIPIIIPCHRVLASSGRSGGFSAPGGVTTKFRILQIEQAGRSGDGSLLFDDLPLAVRNPLPS
jgi:methylated-DNA-[protein]-cysteine S-methyltransferase